MDALAFLKSYINGALLEQIRGAVRPSVVLQRMHVFPEQFSRIVVSEQAHGCTITEETGTLGIATKDRLSGGVENEPDSPRQEPKMGRSGGNPVSRYTKRIQCLMATFPLDGRGRNPACPG